MNVCLYCGSRPGADPAFSAAARDLGAGLAARGWGLVYGGGGVGLMGEAARASLAAGGRVIGIIPRKLLEREQGLREVSELIVTETLRERKAIMFDRADAFIALPGGFGTLEEVVETLTLRQLAYHDKPILFLNTAGYYAPLLDFFEHAIASGFVSPAYRGLYAVVEGVDAALDQLAGRAA